DLKSSGAQVDPSSYLGAPPEVVVVETSLVAVLAVPISVLPPSPKKDEAIGEKLDPLFGKES
ncbi:hypothetical protein HN51_066189, partial [Arachis hypogaea]